MDCMEFRKSLVLLVGRQLSRREEREIRLHREVCPCCDRRARLEERFQAILRQHLGSVAAPAGLRERIRARLAEKEPDSRGPKRGT
jgi:anti-sigma factor (TIGR02949 family)